MNSGLNIRRLTKQFTREIGHRPSYDQLLTWMEQRDLITFSEQMLMLGIEEDQLARNDHTYSDLPLAEKVEFYLALAREEVKRRQDMVTSGPQGKVKRANALSIVRWVD